MKNIHKLKILLFLIIILTVATSCKKEAKYDVSHIRFKVDGVAKNYEYTYLSQFSTLPDGTPHGFRGSACLSEENIELERMEFFIPRPVIRGLNTYTNVGPITEGPNVRLTWDSGTKGVSYITTSTSNEENKVTLTFTEIGADYIKGTFSGTLINTAKPGKPKVSITEGKFLLPLSN